MIGEHFNKTALLCHSLSLLAWFRYIFPNTPLLPSLELLQLELLCTAPAPLPVTHCSHCLSPSCLGECAVSLAVSFYRFLGNLAMNFNWIPWPRAVLSADKRVIGVCNVHYNNTVQSLSSRPRIVNWASPGQWRRVPGARGVQVSGNIA